MTSVPKVELDIDQTLKALPASDLDEWRREQIRRHAHRALARGPKRSWRIWYDRVLEPAAVAAVGIAYLGWAIQMLRFIHG